MRALPLRELPAELFGALHHFRRRAARGGPLHRPGARGLQLVAGGAPAFLRQLRVAGGLRRRQLSRRNPFPCGDPGRAGRGHAAVPCLLRRKAALDRAGGQPAPPPPWRPAIGLAGRGKSRRIIGPQCYPPVNARQQDEPPATLRRTGRAGAGPANGNARYFSGNGEE